MPIATGSSSKKNDALSNKVKLALQNWGLEKVVFFPQATAFVSKVKRKQWVLDWPNKFKEMNNPSINSNFS